jgi:hypothetical protein
MKNITLSVDEKVLAVVRRHAAERNCSFNALVRNYLTKSRDTRGPGQRCAPKVAANQTAVRPETWFANYTTPS